MSVGALRSPPKYSPFFGFSDSAEPMTDVRKMLSPQTAGELQPAPGMSVFHVTFSVVLQVSGRFGSSATPSDPGPRNPGQLSAAAAAAAVRISIINGSAIISLLVMSSPRGFGRLVCGPLANAIQILSRAHENLSI